MENLSETQSVKQALQEVRERVKNVSNKLHLQKEVVSEVQQIYITSLAAIFLPLYSSTCFLLGIINAITIDQPSYCHLHRISM